MRSTQIRTAASAAPTSTITWLTTSSVRRFQRSASTPAGSEKKKTGMPSAKADSPR